MEFKENFKELLSKIENPISDFLLDTDNHDIDENINNINVSSKEGYVSFNRNGRENKTRKKVGRFISMFRQEFTPREIEIFVNEFKSLSGYYKYVSMFELGSGNDFKFSYDPENYDERAGHLGGSCMNSADDRRLKLYVDNPKKIKILMLKTEEGKLLGRAVVWKNAFIREGESAEDRNNSETFKVNIVDRIYTTKDYYISVFEKYAASQGWYVRSGGGGLSFKNADGENVNCRVKINLKDFRFGNYPYLDTMRSVSKKGTISNKRWKDDIRFY